MSLLPPGYLPPPPFPSIGPTGLGGLTGATLNGTGLPYARGVGGLMAGPAGPALPRAFTTAADVSMSALRPLSSSMTAMPADTSLAAQAGRAVSGGGTRGMLGSVGSSIGLSRPGLVKGGLYGLGGSIGGSLVDKANLGGANSLADQFATGATFGGISGLAFGPMGAAIGAPVGGALNVLGNALGLFGGGGEEEPEVAPLDVLSTAIQSANLTPDATENILTTYETLMALAEQQPEGEARDAARQQAFDQTAAMVLQVMQEQQAQQSTAAELSGPSLLAMQQQAAQIFQPLAQDITTGANLYAQAMAGIRDNLPPEYRAIADATVSRELTSADRLANAYQAQAALTPVVDRLTRYQQEQDAFARQQYQQMLAQQAAGGGQAPSDVLMALTPTG